MHIPKRYRPQRFRVDNKRPMGLGTLECSALVFQLCQPTFQKASRVATGSYPESVATECSQHLHRTYRNKRIGHNHGVPPATHQETPA